MNFDTFAYTLVTLVVITLTACGVMMFLSLF